MVSFMINYVHGMNLIGYCEFITLFLSWIRWYTEMLISESLDGHDL